MSYALASFLLLQADPGNSNAAGPLPRILHDLQLETQDNEIGTLQGTKPLQLSAGKKRTITTPCCIDLPYMDVMHMQQAIDRWTELQVFDESTVRLRRC